MSKTYELRKQLQKVHNTATTNVYYEEAPDTKPYPYLVFELSELTHDDGRTLLQLEVNALDYGNSSTAIELISDKLQTTLHKYDFINHEIQFSSYTGKRDIIKEEDKKIIRRRLLFEVNLHELKGE